VRPDRSRDSRRRGGYSGEWHRRGRNTIVRHGRPHRRRIDEATPIFERGRQPSLKIHLPGDVEIVLGFGDSRRSKIFNRLVMRPFTPVWSIGEEVDQRLLLLVCQARKACLDVLAAAHILRDAMHDEIPQHRLVDADESLDHEGRVGFGTLVADVDLL
jgi:hypothetical protein